MYFKVRETYWADDITSNYTEEIKKFLSEFSEIEIVEESVKDIIIQTYYHLSSQNIRKFKMLNINDNNNKILELFKILFDKESIYNYGDEKPIWSVSSGTERYLQSQWRDQHIL